jgi:hypothetical protein
LPAKPLGWKGWGAVILRGSLTRLHYYYGSPIFMCTLAPCWQWGLVILPCHSPRMDTSGRRPSPLCLGLRLNICIPWLISAC